METWSVLFLCRKNLRVAGTVLVFSWELLHAERASFLCLGKASCLGHFQRFILWAFPITECVRVPLMRCPLARPHPFVTAAFFIHVCIQCDSPSGTSKGSGKVATSAFPQLPIFFITPITFHSYFMPLPSLSFFVSLLHFHLCCPIFSFSYPFSVFVF